MALIVKFISNFRVTRLESGHMSYVCKSLIYALVPVIEWSTFTITVPIQSYVRPDYRSII